MRKELFFTAAGLAKLALEQKMILDWSSGGRTKERKVGNKGLPAFTYDKKALHKLCPVKAGEKNLAGSRYWLYQYQSGMAGRRQTGDRSAVSANQR